MVNYLSERIEAFLEKKMKKYPGMQIRCVHEEQALGTAGILPYLSEELDDEFLLLYGDVLFDIDLDRMLGFHRAKRPMPAWSYTPMTIPTIPTWWSPTKTSGSAHFSPSPTPKGLGTAIW